MIKKTREQINTSKTVTAIIIINLIQILTLLVIIIYGYTLINEYNFEIAGSVRMILYVVLGIVILNSIMSIKDIYLLTNIRAKYYMQLKTIHEVEKLNRILLGQRHDFLNHLQVLNSLIYMEEYAELKDYFKRVYHDINKVSRTLKTYNVAVNALLQAKLQECENKGINVELKILTKLENLKIPSWEMCRVLGNLIDNAIDALEFTHDKHLTIEINSDIFGYIFRVIDNGAIISPAIEQKIFEAGFTTKGIKGEGMGLAIVKEIISNYQGKISLSINGNKKVFTIRVPY